MENRKELDFKRVYAYESFVHTIKGVPKMGVKRSIRMIRSSQSWHPASTVVAHLGIQKP